MSPETAATVSSIAAALSAVLTLVAVVVAVLSLQASREDAKQADRNAAEDRRAQSRPMLLPELQKEHLSHGVVNFVMRNWGRSAATNVRVEFTDPQPVDDLESLPDDDMLKWLHRSYASPITLWPPQWKMSHVYVALNDPRRKLTLQVNYEGPDGNVYSDDFTLDPAPLMSQTESGLSKPKNGDLPGWVKDLATSLRAIARKM